MTESNLFKQFRSIVLEELAALAQGGLLPPGLDLTKVTIEPPRDPAHGDMACNAGMVLAKPAGRKPREIAEALGAALAARGGELPVESWSVDGPGFLNVRFPDSVWQDQLRIILTCGLAYGDSRLGAGQAVNVEYVSANPTGPMHIGHARGAVVGDVLAALLEKAGWTVTREYYINDAGAQVDVLARSTFLRYREALGQEIGAIPEGLYPGDYLVPVGQALAARDGETWLNAPEADWLPLFRDFAIDAMMAMIRADLAALGVQHDVFASERAQVEAGAVQAAYDVLEARDLIYIGTLEPPKGKPVEDWEPRPQALFRATRFGDDTDRPLKKSDGSWTYFANDIAYHYDKFRRGHPLLIDVMGADHGGYVKRMQAAVKAMSEEKAALVVRLCQLVNLTKGGVPVKMSKRAGTFVTLREVVDEVGAGVVRFIMLTRKNDATLDFDLQKVTEHSKDNPVFYVQYAHARAESVLRHGHEIFDGLDIDFAALAKAPLTPLTNPAEKGLLRLMSSWPRVVEQAAEAQEPHRIAFYLGDVAAAFHQWWTSGNDAAELRFIRPDDFDVTRARLALVAGVQTIIASGLAVLRVEPVKELR